MFNTILLEKDNGIATITLNRPDFYNAFDNEMSFEFQDALKEVSKDREVRVLIITGAGKAFCSGQDLKDISKEEKRNLGDSLHKRYNPVIRLICNMAKPVLCKLNGVAAGAGCSLALACDMIIASDNATLIEVFINVGLVLDSGSSYFLPRAVGTAKAFEMATMGSKVKAEEAAQIGLINQVVPAGELDKSVLEIAEYYASAPTKAIAIIKKMIRKSSTATLEEMLQYEAYSQEIAGYSEDYKEGIKAFIEKRKPNFKGE
ncbi:MAG: enoyl-CoA hydratase/isomerase family protein [Bacteroidetes bacterium]|nr:enoyl-CoA hydratase/isomerase family protein [Bacteroidota bacterium]